MFSIGMGVTWLSLKVRAVFRAPGPLRKLVGARLKKELTQRSI